MKYVCLVYLEENTLDAMPEAERQALYGECVANDEVLRRNGHCLASEALESVAHELRQHYEATGTRDLKEFAYRVNTSTDSSAGTESPTSASQK